MSTISAASTLYSTILGSTSSSNGSSAQDGVSQALTDLSTALDSSDSTDAQTALTALQTALAAKKSSSQTGSSTSSSSTPFGGNSQANADYTNLVNDVQSGNLTGAQSALANLQSDLKSAKGGHHHHGAPPPPPPTTTDSTDSTQTTSSTDNQAQLSPTTFQKSFTQDLLTNSTTTTPSGTAGQYVNTTV